MDFITDIKKEGNVFLAYLPFDPRAEFGIQKGALYADCIVENVQFKSELLSGGDGRYYVVLGDRLMKDIGICDNVHIKVEPSAAAAVSAKIPEMIENDVLKAISARASIRKFSDKEIDDLQINAILHAGLCAPSAANKRPFHFIVSRDREKMVSIIGDNPYVKMLRSAAACIIVCGDEAVQSIEELLLADCSAATQNILLAIHASGLGGVWCGIRRNSGFYKGIVKEFCLPDNIRPISLIPLGCSAEKVTRPNRFDAGKIHFEVW